MWQAGKCLLCRCNRRLTGGIAVLVPVITIVTNEVCDIAEGLVCNGVLKGQAW